MVDNIPNQDKKFQGDKNVEQKQGQGQKKDQDKNFDNRQKGVSGSGDMPEERSR